MIAETKTDINTIELSSVELKAKGEALLTIKPTTEEEYKQYVDDCNAWVKECCIMYEGNLPSEYAKMFSQAFKELTYGASIRIPGVTPTLDDKRKKIHSDLKAKISKLSDYLRMIRVSDEIVNPELVIKEERNKFTIAQKKLLVLYKLYQYGDYQAYEVNYILSANGVKNTNYQEVVGIVKSLEDYGYVKTLPTSRSVMAQLTSNGKEYIEEVISKAEAEQKQEATSVNKNEIEEINERLDEVMEWLKRNDMGNEIIFNEIQELKDAGEKLNLKNWKQLVKGKLYDMATEKVVGIGLEGLREMLKALTGEDPTKLLK